MKVGTRVAVVSADMGKFLGYGEYLGDHYHAGLAELSIRAIGAMPDIDGLCKADRDKICATIRAGKHPFIGKNPKIRLDDGTVAWGCETWWGPADQFIANGHAKKYGATVA